MHTIIRTALTTGLAGLIVACGSDGGGGGGGGEGEKPQEARIILPADGSNIDGLYQAKFITLNSHVNGTVPGSFTFLRDKDRVMFFGRVFAGYPKAWHQQFIHMGTRCPTAKDDLNKDGYVDMEEARKVVGKVIIPLDSDPGSQSSGKRFFPLGDLSGSYHYERVTRFSRIFRDLKAKDPDPEDDIAKLGPEEGFELEGKVVLIHGTNDTVEFPETVKGFGRFQPFQTLPVACGIFRKVTEIPGEHPEGDGGPIPGPVAEVDPNWDRPAPEVEIPEGGGPEAPGTGTGTNSTDDGEVSDGGVGRETRPAPAPSRDRGREREESPRPTPDREDRPDRPERPSRPERDTDTGNDNPEPQSDDTGNTGNTGGNDTEPPPSTEGGRGSIGSGRNSDDAASRIRSWWRRTWSELTRNSKPTLWADEDGRTHRVP